MVDRLSRAVAATGTAALGAGLSTAALRAATASGAVPRRTNFRGSSVSMAGGPAVAFGATVAGVAGAQTPCAAVAVAIAGTAAGLVGGYDDLAGTRTGPAGDRHRTTKGFKGHLGALRQGEVTSGMVKLAGLGVASLIAATALTRTERHRRGPGGAAGKALDVVVGAGLIAGTANLVNLLDLRPGRALKAVLVTAAPLAVGRGPGRGIAAAAAGAAAGLLKPDLTEQVMIGDSGANAVGAVLGTALVQQLPRPARIIALAAIVGLTAASEKISFSKVITTTPVLRELDQLGRRA